MVSQLPRVSSVKPSFDYIENVYKPSLKVYLDKNNYKNWQDARNAIERGRKIIVSDEEVDTYIAFYGAHHYYKLEEAFNTLNMSRFSSSQLEIVSYGCGAATDICSLISYCHLKSIALPFKSLKLIEPSHVALKRGIEYIKGALSNQELDTLKIKETYKTIDKLEKNDIYSEPENLKLHIFSNVLDIQAINLDNLAQLIYNTQSGTNYLICVNPKNSESQSRIDDFHKKLSKLFNLSNIDTNDRNIMDKQIWVMKWDQYCNYPIPRYCRIFKIN